MADATPTGVILPFPGRNSLLDPSDLLAGSSAAIAQDCIFGPGWVKTRPGFGATYSGISGSPSINGIVRTARLDGSARVLLFTAAGALVPEATEGTLGTNIESALGHNQRMVGSGLAGRSILAFSDWQKGLQPVMIYAEPSQIGLSVMPPSRLGVPPPPNAVSVADDTAAGVVTVGVHQLVTVARSSTDGSSSSPSGQTTWTAAGGKQARVTWAAIQTAPPDLLFDLYMTAAGGGYFYFTGVTVPVLTFGAAINVSDAYLLSQKRLDYPDNLYNRFEPPAAAGVFGPYHGRICLTGLVHNFAPGYVNGLDGVIYPNKPIRNLNFAYGFDNTITQDWTYTAATGASLQRDVTPNGASYWTYAKIVGDGASATRGQFGLYITNLAAAMAPGVGQIGLRVRARKTAGLSQGDLTVQILAGGSVSFTAVLPNASLSTDWQTFELPVMYLGTTPLIMDATQGNVLYTLVFWGSNTPTNLGEIHVDYIEPYGVTRGRDPYTAFWNYGQGSASGREFSSDSCAQVVGYGDGEDLIGGFELGGRWYYYKTRSTWVTDDNGNEPGFWTVPQKIANVGSPSLAGVSRGEEWVVILSRSGLYQFQGGGLSNENRISDEIQPDWDSLNWNYGHKMWVEVDTERKRIVCGVIVGGGSDVNQLWVLDYKEGFGNASVYSPYSQAGYGRKWSFWSWRGTCGALIERATTGLRQLWLGNNTANGKVYALSQDVAPSYVDDGSGVIPFVYETGNFIAGGQPGFMGLFTKVVFNCDGADAAGPAYLDLSYTRTDNVNVALPSLPIYNPALGDPFTKFRFLGDRIRIRFGSSVVNRWAMVHGLTVENRKTRFRSSRLTNP